MRRLLVLIFLAALGSWLPAQAQPRAPPAKPPPPPGMDPFAWYWPDRAQRMEIDGKAIMNCEVDAEGRFQDCRLVSESPEGYGFGAATLAVAPYFKIKPKLDADGHPIPGGRLDFPLIWKQPQDDKANKK